MRVELQTGGGAVACSTKSTITLRRNLVASSSSDTKRYDSNVSVNPGEMESKLRDSLRSGIDLESSSCLSWLAVLIRGGRVVQASAARYVENSSSADSGSSSCEGLLGLLASSLRAMQSLKRVNWGASSSLIVKVNVQWCKSAV